MRMSLAILLLSFGASLFAQAPDTLWTRIYGGGNDDFARAILETQSGYVVGANTRSFGHGDVDFWFLRLDSNGDSAYSRTYGGTGEDGCLDLIQTSDGGYLMAGWSESYASVWTDGWLLKMDSNGDSTWSTHTSFENDNFYWAVEQLADSGFAAAGMTGNNDGQEDMLLSRFNQNGSLIWTKSLGGPRRQFAHSFDVCADGGFVLAGYTWPSGGQGVEFFVLKTNSSGDSLWSKTWGNGSSTSETIHHIEELENGDFFVAGFANAVPSNGASSDQYVARLSSNGTILWSRTTNLGGQDSFYGGMVVRHGGLVCAGDGLGSSTRDAWVVRYADNGDSLWSFGYSSGSSNLDLFWDIHEASDGGYIVCGGNDSEGSGASNLYVVRLDTDPFNRGVFLTSPNGLEELEIFSTDTIRWKGVGFAGGVSIELNRNFPNGTWETVSSLTENDGEYEWFVNGPPSDSCRIRICALQDTFCDFSDNDFSIVSALGYLELVRTDQPNTPIQSWNAGVVECPQTTSQWFKLKNTGQDDLSFRAPLEPASSAFFRITNCSPSPLGTILNPGEVSACSVQVAFAPFSDGVFHDVLVVETNAQNAVGDEVSFSLSGTQISTPAAPQVVITTQGENAFLYWSPVDTSVGGCAVSGLRYLVFHSPTTGGPFYYLGGTESTTFTHVWTVTYEPSMFYQVVAVKALAQLVAEIEPETEMDAVLRRLRVGNMR